MENAKESGGVDNAHDGGGSVTPWHIPVHAKVSCQRQNLPGRVVWEHTWKVKAMFCPS